MSFSYNDNSMYDDEESLEEMNYSLSDLSDDVTQRFIQLISPSKTDYKEFDQIDETPTWPREANPLKIDNQLNEASYGCTNRKRCYSNPQDAFTSNCNTANYSHFHRSVSNFESDVATDLEQALPKSLNITVLIADLDHKDQLKIELELPRVE